MQTLLRLLDSLEFKDPVKVLGVPWRDPKDERVCLFIASSPSRVVFCVQDGGGLAYHSWIEGPRQDYSNEPFYSLPLEWVRWQGRLQEQDYQFPGRLCSTREDFIASVSNGLWPSDRPTTTVDLIETRMREAYAKMNDELMRQAFPVYYTNAPTVECGWCRGSGKIRKFEWAVAENYSTLPCGKCGGLGRVPSGPPAMFVLETNEAKPPASYPGFGNLMLKARQLGTIPPAPTLMKMREMLLNMPDPKQEEKPKPGRRFCLREED